MRKQISALNFASMPHRQNLPQSCPIAPNHKAAEQTVIHTLRKAVTYKMTLEKAFAISHSFCSHLLP
jgi:hypothetical protein